MASGDIIRNTDIQSKYTAYLNGYQNYVWSLQSYPSYFPTAYLGSGPLSTTIQSPNPGDIITALASISNAVINTAKALTAIVTCRYVLKFNDNGTWRVDFDQTQKALFNTGYIKNLTSTINSGDQIFDSTLNAFFNSIKNQVANYQAQSVYLESTYCHSSCHSSCFTGDTKLNLLHNNQEIQLTFKELEESLDTIDIDDFKILTPEGYQSIAQLFINGEKDVFLINEKIKCTIDHKFVTDIKSNTKIEIGYLLNKEIETITGKELITSIIYLGKEDVYDLEVYHANHRYIVNNCYVVSNCHSSRGRR